MDKEQLFSIGEVARLFHMSVSSPVSYTHLDVYKRQLQYTVFGPEDLLEILSRIMPDEVLPLFDDFLQKLYPKSGAAVISVSAVTAAWSASNGIYGMARGLGAVLGVKETRSYVHMRLLCLFYMLLFVPVSYTHLNRSGAAEDRGRVCGW